MKNHIDLTNEYVLENSNVLLRPMRISDLNNLLKFSIEEPHLWKYSLVTAAGAENLQKYIQLAEKGRAQQKEYAFIVFDKKRNEYAGSTRFYDIQPEYQTVQLGYTWYGKDFQGTGVNKNCKYLLLEFAFETWEVERVEFRADNNNERSIAAMKSIGCTVEGVLRSNMPKREGGRRDSIVLSILKPEWKDGIKENLKKRI
ncbi:GNAT family protein [Segetibacter sp.]|jgi:RimJ/RimL family protein N-acetyltransferase|uniref:GNAT family N-acetyltransferase n=1 Tax=Segetibacter sp. TaxID=2231182 RepID=UPI0026237EDE|nr:GNAT family protein [Segetibacter sp.]MCW3082362.1 acetyltransferase, ribosomal protein N-acetylase [Segetibacter sp.]